MPFSDEHLAQARMAATSVEWSDSLRSGEHLSLASCFRFVKSKMNVSRDMQVIADVARRREYCVALYEYTHRDVGLGDADAAFVERYDDAQRRQRGPQPRPAGPGAEGDPAQRRQRVGDGP